MNLCGMHMPPVNFGYDPNYLFRMILDETDFGLILKVQTDRVRYNEYWLADAMDTAWTIWSSIEIGLNGENTICNPDWDSLRINTEKRATILMIKDFRRVVNDNSFCFLDKWELMLKVFEILLTKKISFQDGVELREFKHSCKNVLLGLIETGLNLNGDMEFYLDPYYEVFHDYPVHVFPKRFLLISVCDDLVTVFCSDEQ